MKIKIKILFVIALLLAVCLCASGCVEREKIIYVNGSSQDIPAPSTTEKVLVIYVDQEGHEVAVPTPSTTEKVRVVYVDQEDHEVAVPSASAETIAFQSQDLKVYRGGSYYFPKGDYTITGDGYNGFYLPDAYEDIEGNQIEVRLRFNQDTQIDRFKWQINKNDGSKVPENYRKFDNPIVFQRGEIIKVVLTPDPPAKAERTCLLSGYNNNTEVFVVESGIDENKIEIEEVFNPAKKWK